MEKETVELQQELESAMTHMEALMAQLPFAEEKQREYARQMKINRIAQLFETCGDLSSDLKSIEAEDPASFGGAQLYNILVREKRELYIREKQRLDAELASSSFSSPLEALRAKMPRDKLNELIREMNAFRADYAYTLRRCEECDRRLAPLG